MSKADLTHDSTRTGEGDGKENNDEERSLILRRSFSEDRPLFELREDWSSRPKSKKLKSLRSGLSFRIRTLRDSRTRCPKTSLVEAFHSKSQEQSVDNLITERVSHSIETTRKEVKKKKKFSKKISLIGLKWPKSKSADRNPTTTATRTPSSPAQENSLSIPPIPHVEQTALLEQVQKLQITISGRKTEYKSSLAMKSATKPPSKIDNLRQSQETNQFNITQSEIDTPPAERAPLLPHEAATQNLNSALAPPESSSSESLARMKGAVRKSPRLPRLECQASGEEFFEEDNAQLMLPDIPCERGSRFPRPTLDSPLPNQGRNERLNWVKEYINETFGQTNFGEPNTTSNLNYMHLAVTKRLSKSPPLRDTNDNKDFSIFHSANSTDSNGSPISDAGRRRIKYIGQSTFYTDEEKEILEGKCQAFQNLSGISEYSFESDYPSESQKPAFGDLVMDPEEAQIMTSATEKREHLYKILVIGELGTGKTSFIKRYVHQFFSANYRATIGVDFALKVLHWDQNTIVRLQLWDIAGQERFGNMTRVYYKEAVGAFIVFDVTRSGTFDAVSKWKEDLDSKVQLPGGGSIPCILLANKCDQEKQGMATNPEKMDEYVEENDFSGWFETSAKENTNIEEAARALVSQILLNDKLITVADIIDNDKFALGSTNGQKASSMKKNCSC